MRSTLAIFILIAGHVLGQSVSLTWTPPTNGVPTDYVLFQGASHGAYSMGWNIGTATSFNLPTANLLPGVNYFAVTAWSFTNGVLAMSAFSNEAIVTNTPALAVSSILFGGTNLAGAWLPVQTNRFIISPTNAQMFFRAGGLSISRTNIQAFAPPSP
jgi:hypothetical protein